MKKIDEVNKTDSTWNKIPDDEIVFILRAQDVLAADAVRYWVQLAHEAGVGRAKIDEAVGCAAMMEEHRSQKRPD